MVSIRSQGFVGINKKNSSRFTISDRISKFYSITRACSQDYAVKVECPARRKTLRTKDSVMLLSLMARIKEDKTVSLGLLVELESV